MAESKRILYRGVPMIEGWPEKIQAAQLVPSYMLNGKAVARIRYGDEQDDWNARQHPRHDCRVLKGEFHVPDCDVEERPVCHGQLLSCDCPFDDREDEVSEM
jgi:hypothetical protein